MELIDVKRCHPYTEMNGEKRCDLLVWPRWTKAKYLFVGLLFIGTFLPPMKSQDIHLSHIHASPTYLNPAMTGLFNADMRFIGNYKSQWQTFTNGYRTFVGSADMKLNKGFGLQDDVGVGFQVISDQAGDLDFNTFSATLSASYLKALNAYGDHFISLGLQTGIIQNRLDITKIRVFDEDPYVQNADFLSQISYFDLSLGMAWFAPLRGGNFFYLGGSIFHLNRALVSFMKDAPDYQGGSFLIPKYVAHGGAEFKLSKFATLKPSFIFLDQHPHRELNMGTFLKITRDTRDYLRPEYAVYAGFWYRWSIKDGVFNRDAIIATLRYDFRQTVFSFSFDLNISELAKASRGFGGPELSVMHYIDTYRTQRKRSKVKCPEF